MKKVFDLIASRRIFILVASVILLIYGVYSYITIPKQEMPDMIAPMGVVQVIAPGLSANEIEETITDKVEDLINSYDEVEKYTSTTIDNVVFITVEYDFDIKDTDGVSNEIASKLADMELPDEVSERYFITDFDIPHAVFAVYKNDDFRVLEEQAEILKNKFLDIENVKSVEIDSPYDEYIEVSVDYNILRYSDITLKDIYGAIYAYGTKIPVGSIVENEEFISVNVSPEYKSIIELESLVISFDQDTGLPVTLSDISTIALKHENTNKEYYYQDEMAVMVEVYFEEDIDFTKIGHELTDVMNEFNEDSVISSVSVVNFIPDYVDAQISNAMGSLLLCIVIVMFVVMLGLGIRNTIGIAFTIPVIVFTTIAILDLGGFALQKVSIAGIIISIGILVDNSIVISEAIQYYLDEGKKMTEAVKSSIKDNAVPVLTSTLTTIAAFIPLTMLPGLAGQMAGSLPLTVMTAIALSYVFAMLVTPVIASFLFKPKKKKSKKASKVLDYLVKGSLKNAWIVIFVSFLLVIGAVYFIVLDRPIEMFPPDEKTNIYIDYEHSAYDKDLTYEYAKEIESVLADDAYVKDYSYSVGGSLPLFSLNVRNTDEVQNVGRFYLDLDMEIDEVSGYINDLQSKLDLIEDDGVATVNQITLGINSASVELLLTSYDSTLLDSVIENVEGELDDLDNIRAYQITQNTYKKEYKITPDKTSLLTNGLTVIELEEFLAINLNGLSADVYKHGDDTLDVLVKSNFVDMDDILDLSLNGTLLSDLLTIEETESLDSLYRYNGRNLVKIEAEAVSGYSDFDLEKDILNIIDKYANDEIMIEAGGNTALTMSIFGDIGFAAAIAVVLIYLIMFVQFNSYKQPLIVFIAIPLSLIGSSVMLYAFDAPISLTSLLGVVSLIGVVVNTGILLVDYINKAVAEGKNIFDACLESVKRRLRPILLASVTTILGMIPLVINGGEFFSPLAIVFMGGIIASTILTIFVVPALYYVLESN